MALIQAHHGTRHGSVEGAEHHPQAMPLLLHRENTDIAGFSTRIDRYVAHRGDREVLVAQGEYMDQSHTGRAGHLELFNDAERCIDGGTDRTGGSGRELRVIRLLVLATTATGRACRKLDHPRPGDLLDATAGCSARDLHNPRWDPLAATTISGGRGRLHHGLRSAPWTIAHLHIAAHGLAILILDGAHHQSVRLKQDAAGHVPLQAHLQVHLRVRRIAVVELLRLETLFTGTARQGPHHGVIAGLAHRDARVRTKEEHAVRCSLHQDVGEIEEAVRIGGAFEFKVLEVGLRGLVAAHHDHGYASSGLVIV